MFESLRERRDHYRTNVRTIFGATADLYYALWGEHFHLGIFERGADAKDFDAALERTHQKYFKAIDGARAGRILELGCGGGAFAAWMAERTQGEIVGVDISDIQLAHARAWASRGQRQNLRFIEHDIMRIGDLDEPPFDAAVCLDAACYLPDKQAALQGIATRLRRGASLLLVDWCRAERPTAVQEEMILEPLYRYWGIPEMETIVGYEQAFKAAGLRILELEDLSEQVAPNWERGYEASLRALAESTTLDRLRRMAASTFKYGPHAVQIAKNQFYAALFAKVAAEGRLLRYTYFLAEQT